jgi:hypothetical protein
MLSLVTLPPKTERDRELGRGKIPVLPWHVRAARGWENKISLWPKPRRPGVIIKKSGLWHEESLAETWGTYVPTIPERKRESSQYPLPLSEEFWRLYAEPATHLVSAAVRFRNAVERISKPQEDPSAARSGVDILHDLTEGVRPIIVFNKDHRWEQTWVAPSLLSTFAMMALLDQLDGCRVIQCLCCKKAVWTKNPRKCYCDENRCRWVAQKRSQRGRRKDEARPRGRPRKKGTRRSRA